MTIFSEDFGNGGTGAISTNSTSFQNNSCQYSYTGSGSVGNSTPTVSPTPNYILLNIGQSFTITGINTLGFSSTFLSYSLLKDPVNLSFLNADASGLTIAVSINGGAFNNITRNQNTFNDNTWITETTGSVTSATNISVRFTNNSHVLPLNGVDIKIDNLSIIGATNLSVSSPTPFPLTSGGYTLTPFPSTTSAGTYPANMIFHYGTTNTVEQSTSAGASSQDYALPYNLSCGTRIVGQNTNGISFRNEIPGNYNAARGNLGDAVLSLNTTCRGSITVQWVAGVITPTTSNVYNLRAQYRVGTTATFTDLPGATSSIEYSSNSPSTSVTFSPIILPAICENTTDVQVRWVYYHASGSGAPSEIFLDDIIVTSQPYPVVSPFAKPTICGGDTMPPTLINPLPTSFTWANSNTTLVPVASAAGTAFPGFRVPVLPDTLDQTATINYTAIAGSCTNTSSFSITVRGVKFKTTWNGNDSNDWFNHDNWSDCVCHDSAAAKISSGGFPATIVNGRIGKAKSLAIANTASLIVNSGGTLEIKEELDKSGYALLTGSVILSGTVTTTLSANNSSTTFSTLIVNNPFGVFAKDSVDILGCLQINSGTFSTNNKLKLKSTNLSTARTGPIVSGANIIGDVTIERLAPGGATGWAQFGAPITSSNTFAQWDDDFVITCASCPDGFFNFTSIYSYSEAAGGTSSYNDPLKYIPITNTTNSTTIGKGYWVYFGNGNTSTDIKFAVTGPVVTNSIGISVTNSSAGDPPNNGWNLISNPMPSALSWTNIAQANQFLENAYYVYNADLNSNSGGYASYVNAITTPTNGLTNDIPMCQGFYVHALSSGTILINESMKSSGDPVFMKPQPSAIKPVFRLSQNSTKHHDECALYFESGATKQFQGNYDAYKLNFDPDNIPYIGSFADSILTSINGLPPLSANITVDVKAISPFTGSFSFSGIVSDFPYDVCVTLKDKYTGATTDLLKQTYTCTLYDTTTAARFQLSFFSYPVNASDQTVQPDCDNPTGGFITAYAKSSGPWNYEWSKNGSVIKTTLSSPIPDTLKHVNGGQYSVKINTAGQCDRFENAYYVNKVESTSASFASDIDTAYLSNGATVYFVNNSINHMTSEWDFGEGPVTVTNADPSYSYSLSGLYRVRLFTESPTGCADTAEKNILVLDDVTGLSLHSMSQDVLMTYDQSNKEYSCIFNINVETNVDAELLDQHGRILIKENWGLLKRGTKKVNLNLYNEGVYLLRLQLNDQAPLMFKLIR